MVVLPILPKHAGPEAGAPIAWFRVPMRARFLGLGAFQKPSAYSKSLLEAKTAPQPTTKNRISAQFHGIRPALLCRANPRLPNEDPHAKGMEFVPTPPGVVQALCLLSGSFLFC
jgi:hypothetical protein